MSAVHSRACLGRIGRRRAGNRRRSNFRPVPANVRVDRPPRSEATRGPQAARLRRSGRTHGWASPFRSWSLQRVHAFSAAEWVVRGWRGLIPETPLQVFFEQPLCGQARLVHPQSVSHLRWTLVREENIVNRLSDPLWNTGAYGRKTNQGAYPEREKGCVHPVRRRSPRAQGWCHDRLWITHGRHLAVTPNVKFDFSTDT